MTNEELENELVEVRLVLTRLMTHCQELGESIRIASVITLAQVRQLNEAYKQHATFMSEIDTEMKAYTERKDGI